MFSKSSIFFRSFSSSRTKHVTALAIASTSVGLLLVKKAECDDKSLPKIESKKVYSGRLDWDTTVPDLRHGERKKGVDGVETNSLIEYGVVIVSAGALIGCGIGFVYFVYSAACNVFGKK